MAPLSSAEHKARRLAPLGLLCLTCLTCILAMQGTPVHAALEVLDEQSLSAIDAQDGVILTLSNPVPAGITLASSTWHTDNNGAAVDACTGGVANQQACTILSGGLAGVGGAPLSMTATIDAGSAAAGSNPQLQLNLDWQPLLLKINSATLNTPTVDYSATGLNRSYGSIGVYSTGHLHLTNHGVFDGSVNTALFDFSSTGDVIYRQGSGVQPELSLGNFILSNRFTTGAALGQADGMGTLGIDDTGLIVSAPFASVSLLFDLMFKSASTAAGFDTTGRSGLIKFGWQGGLKNPFFRLAGGGVGYGAHATGSGTYQDYSEANGSNPATGALARSEGLNLLAQWDFDSDFMWILGQAGGNGTQARFTKWRAMGNSASPMLSMPVTLDVLQNGIGPAGLCFGGGFASGSPIQGSCTSAATAPSGVAGAWQPSTVPAGKAAMAVQIRDGHLHAYNQQIQVVDPLSPNPLPAPYDWSLVYTMGKLDADFLLYPEGRGQGIAPATTTIGLKADITMTIQSPGYWDKANCTLSSSTTICSAAGTPTAANAALVRASAGAGWATNTHFMIADTAVDVDGSGPIAPDATKQYGVGLINADLLWTARDLYFRVVSSDSGYTQMPGGIWLQSGDGTGVGTAAVYRFRGLFGGGNLINLGTLSALGLLDVKLSTNRFIFALSPVAPDAGGDAPIGFAGLLDLDGSSYLSLGEVSAPQNAFRISNMSGRIGWKNGTVNLVSGQNTVDNLPKLALDNDLVFGSSGTFGPTDVGAPVIASVGFGSENFGRITLPAGTWHSNISIKIPGN